MTYWDRLTSPALGRVDRATPVILPMAATEQHGVQGDPSAATAGKGEQILTAVTTQLVTLVASLEPS